MKQIMNPLSSLDHLYKGVSMTFKEMSALLRVYIDANYIQTENTSAAAYVAEAEEGAEVPKGMDKESSDPYVKKEHFTLDQLMDEVGESFHEMLFLKIDMSGMTDVEVYKRAGIDRKLFSKIRSNPAYHPRKQTVLALAIALKLNMDDTVDLLARAEYALSPGNKGDLIVRFFIERGLYDIDTINYALYEYGQPILG